MKLESNKKKVIFITLIFIIGFIIINNLNLNQKTIESPDIQISEQETGKGKIITISAPDELNYENILSYTELSKEAPAEKIHLYHLTEQGKQKVEIEKYDKNNNGLIDYVEWTVPHLSEQTYELIIEITKAEHLDENKNFISDIYNYVNETDNVTYTIPEDEYVRAYFETNLTNENVIDIYVHNKEPATIEIYEKDSDVVVGKIENVLKGVYYINLNHSGSQDVFDLKSVKGDVVYDYVHDGQAGPMTINPGPTDDGPKEAGQSITFTATATDDAGGGGPYNYILVICNNLTTSLACAKTPSGTCEGTGAAKLCESASAVASGQETSCTHSTSEELGTMEYTAWACNINGDDDNAAQSNPYTYTVTAAPDNDPPYFTTIPSDANLGEGESLGVDFDATDAVGFDSYAINWTTTFSINSTGGLKNISALSVGSYKINVTINDTSNNLNSTIYGVTVTSDTCTAPGSGNWAITCSDNCTWSTDFAVPANITMTGSGTLTWNANMSMNSSVTWEIFKEDSCEMVINPEGSIT